MEPHHENESEFAGILIGNKDHNKRAILDVYANQDGRYAVYQTSKRVVVLFAEDPLVQRAQRKRLATLATLRSEIDGDLAAWRSRDGLLGRLPSRLPKTALQFDMRVASALIETLEGDSDAGNSILTGVRTEIVNEKASRARLSYLVWTFTSALVFIALCLIAYNSVAAVQSYTAPTKEAAFSILHACIAGVLGTIYFIAIGIERREIRNDMRQLDHISDAVVRICIGVLAAFVLETFLTSGTLQISFGGGPALTGVPSSEKGIYDTAWPIELIVGFLAGYAERLVPDLLSSYEIKPREPDPVMKPAPPPAIDAIKAPDQVEDPEAPVAESEDDDVDGCDVDLSEASALTPDDSLPPASGGVARE
jgi:hypothetical protein